MKWNLHFGMALALASACLVQSGLRAGDKKEPDKKNEQPKEVVVNGELINADLKDKVRTGMYCKTYTYKMIEGRNYQIDMKSKAFDSYLRLEDPAGQQIAEDDDSGGFPDARIIIRAPKTGDYTIVATTYAPGATGKFNLIVKDLTGGPVPKQDKKDGEKKDKLGQQVPPANTNVGELGVYTADRFLRWGHHSDFFFAPVQ